MIDFIDEYTIGDDVCDGLLTLYDECQHVSKPGTLGHDHHIDHSIKKCTDLYLSLIHI